jgi:hypothetical protein
VVFASSTARIDDALIERKVPLVWEINDIKRVQDPAMSNSDQTLLLLYVTPGWVSDKSLASWVDYSSASMFRTRVLGPLHEERLIEYDRANLRVHIWPRGSKMVYDKLIRAHANTFEPAMT